ncbi:CPCC family cysteine-rich protein [Ruegeria atlantica]|uniref:CPCC family cysteine-rich protein n=1 Tax=Ruegeria atlantica TaxID=81569 RepID=UPI00147F2ABC
MKTQANDVKGYPCACCGFLTRSEKYYGSFDICPICYWEDDNLQADDPTFEGGSNTISLLEARENFLKIGAIKPEYVKLIRRPTGDEIPDIQ